MAAIYHVGPDTRYGCTMRCLTRRGHHIPVNLYMHSRLPRTLLCAASTSHPLEHVTTVVNAAHLRQATIVLTVGAARSEAGPAGRADPRSKSTIASQVVGHHASGRHRSLGGISSSPGFPLARLAYCQDAMRGCRLQCFPGYLWVFRGGRRMQGE
ncbi:hypothetical protein OBBRIDRAFT_272877 [Obba rivulosa]|uniref:Uncharacterized protein n=1 Tax=Obba rivulosa TaxID=1052685 RepID=A0A8E2AV28_9APHY|nr:hypothetical protein OBBRIDRAFT_272877 [Obba rivulosa]